MVNYSPWHIQKLVDWLRLELSVGKSSQELAENLCVSQDLLDDWLTLPLPNITLDNIRSIAHYRGWSVDRTAQWLGISSNHLAELKQWALMDLWLEQQTSLQTIL